MALFSVPIEPLDQRYTAQWLRWFDSEFDRLGVAPNFILPQDFGYSRVERGQFLDVVSTNRWKALQLERLCVLIDNGTIKDNDVIFFHDLWFPGIEMLFYMRDGLGRRFHIAGILHAGTYDKHDFLTQRGMARWAADLERVWLKEYDLIFVSTPFHADLLLSSRMQDDKNLDVSGLPLMSSEFKRGYRTGVPRENTVVFPHRLAPEKQPELFDKLAEQLGGRYTYIKTQAVPRTKDEYCALLASAKVAVSFALQETWGIGMQEATYLGCIPIVPSRLAYRDIYPPELQYKTWSELVDKVKSALDNYDLTVGSAWYRDWLWQLKQHNDKAIERMVASMRARSWQL